MRTTSLVLFLAGVITPAASAQNLTLGRVGGGLGQLTSFPLHGQPAEAYVVLFDLIEQSTPIPQLGVTLDITDQFAWLSFSAPTFFGVTDAAGDAAAQVILPNDPTFEGLVFSLQAIAGNGPWRVSNLVRLTPQLPGTFKAALNAPSVPIAGGGFVHEGADVLFVGGSGPVAQRYQGNTEEWQLAGVSFGVGLLSQTTPLADGRLLFTGGLDLTTGQPTSAAAIYDPATQTTTTLAMGTARAGHGASLLGNGKVLVTGGLSAFDLTNPLASLTGLLGSSEFFDPATGAFAPGPNMLEPRALHTSTTLTNGQALIAGGISLLPIVNIPLVSSTAYKFNPATNSFGLPAVFNGGRLLHSAVALSDGKVLLVGGLTLDLTGFLTSGSLQDLVIGTRTDCQLFAQGLFGFGTFTTVNGLQVGRAGAGLAALPGGKALITGGFQLTVDIATSTFVADATASAEVFSQGPNTLTPVGDMTGARLFPIGVPLSDGTVMVVGGGPTEAEIFQP